MTSASLGSSPHPRLSLPGLIAFSLPGVCIGALAVALSVYLPRYYAGHVGLGLRTVGFVFMAVRLLDMLLDPVIGVLMDRTRTGFGRYRIWLAFGAIASCISMSASTSTSPEYPLNSAGH